MQLKTLWLILARRWWMVLLVGVVAAASAYAFSKMKEPVYVASSKLYIMPARPDYGLFSQAIVNQYSQLAASDKFLKSANEKLKLDLSLVALREKVSSYGKPQDLMIILEVRDVDPERANSIARQVAQDFVQDQDVRMEEVARDNRIEVRMYDEPSIVRTEAANSKSNTLAGGFLGLLVGATIAFSLHYLEDTIKNVEDVERYIDLPVVGSIPAFHS